VPGADPTGEEMKSQGISIHVMDVGRGVVAEGMRVEVYALEPTPHLICGGIVGADALFSHPALEGVFEPGRYEAVFYVADYYRVSGVDLPGVPFMDVVGYRFGIADPARHYHLPFKVTPWGFSLFVTCRDGGDP
jgi:5-hydroxyisourate hydrolase